MSGISARPLLLDKERIMENTHCQLRRPSEVIDRGYEVVAIFDKRKIKTYPSSKAWIFLSLVFGVPSF